MTDNKIISNKIVEQEDEEIGVARRKFIKKVAYSAPKLIVLGYLSKSDVIHADGTGGPDGPPDGWDPW